MYKRISSISVYRYWGRIRRIDRTYRVNEYTETCLKRHFVFKFEHARHECTRINTFRCLGVY